MAAGAAGAGAEVDDVVSAADGVFVVLDHDDGVAQRAQRFQRGQQAGVVAVVQADGRFIQHVEHSPQARADLRGQPHALGFAAGKRRGRAVEREIAQADRQQKLQPLADFGQHAPGNLPLARAQRLFDGADGPDRRAHRLRRELVNGDPGDFYRQRLRPQPPARAGGAEGGGHELLHPLVVVLRP